MWIVTSVRWERSQNQFYTTSWARCRIELTGVCVSTRNAGSCCPPRGRAEAVTRWTATSCARAAALGASRTCRPKSPPTADLEKTPLRNTTLCCAASCRSAASLIPVRERCLLQIRSTLTSKLVSFHSETQTFPFCCSFSPDLQAAWAPCSI